MECEQVGASTAVARRREAHERLPGFGHRIYRGEDPRLRPLLEAVGELPDPDGRRDVVDDLLIEAGIRLTHRPNVDLGLGALSFVGQLPPDMPLFAVARIAGFAAHVAEELVERPLRFRGMARRPPDVVEGESRPRWMADRRRCRSLLVSPGPAGSVGELPVVVPVEAEVDEASQVDRGAAVGEPDAVAGDAAVADFAAAVGG